MTSRDGGTVRDMAASSWPSPPPGLHGALKVRRAGIICGEVPTEAPVGRGGEALHRQMAGTPLGHRSHAEASLSSSLQPKTEPREQPASKGAKIYHELITIGHPSSDFYKTPV